MNQSALELVITLKANEGVLRDIKTRLTALDDGHSSLGDALAAMIKEKLAAAGASNELQVECHCGQIKSRFDIGGGLNAEEWLDSGKK